MFVWFTRGFFIKFTTLHCPFQMYVPHAHISSKMLPNHRGLSCNTIDFVNITSRHFIVLREASGSLQWLASPDPTFHLRTPKHSIDTRSCCQGVSCCQDILSGKRASDFQQTRGEDQLRKMKHQAIDFDSANK